jgi:prepilin-type N-terminal cleavage/methylation domain-containing protein
MRGFTMIELMIVVAIAGVLASVATPAFMRYVRKAKTTEAVLNVRRMYEGGRAYILEESAGRGLMAPVARQFPESAAITPAATCCDPSSGDKCLPDAEDWQTSTWQALRFAMEDPHYFRYEFASTGSANPGSSSRFTARAQGDLDCDGAASTFEMVGAWSDRTHDVQGSAAFFRKDDLE